MVTLGWIFAAVTAVAALILHRRQSSSTRPAIVSPLLTTPKFVTARPMVHDRSAVCVAADKKGTTVDVTQGIANYFNRDGTDNLAVGEDKFDVTQMPGVVAPTGYFDPLGLSKKKSEQRMRWFAEAELKHGRVAMLAALGFIVQESFHPLFGGGDDLPSAFSFQQTPLENFWGPVVAALAMLESFGVNKVENPSKGFGVMKPDHELGNLNFDPLGLKPTDPAALRTVKNRELSNGRLAMLGIAGMVAQELVDGKKILESDSITGLAPPIPAWVGVTPAAAQSLDIDDVHAIAAEMSDMLNGTLSF